MRKIPFFHIQACLVGLLYLAISLNLVRALPEAGRMGEQACRLAEGRCPVCGMRCCAAMGMRACLTGRCCCALGGSCCRVDRRAGVSKTPCFCSCGCGSPDQAKAPAPRAQIVPVPPRQGAIAWSRPVRLPRAAEPPLAFPDPPEKIPLPA